jgi:signal transduction histidine kinase
MRTRVLRTLRSDPEVFDGFLALILWGLNLVELWGARVPSGWGPVTVPLSLCLAGPLVWRRRQPLIALAFFVAAFSAELFVFDLFESLSTLAVWGVVTYSIAAYSDLPRALAGGMITFAGVWAFVAANPAVSAAGVEPGDLGLVVVPWLAGLAIRSYRSRAVDLEDRAARLERERELKAREAVADERSRIARELHDVVAHGVSVIVLQAEMGDALFEIDPEKARSAFASIQEMGRQSLAELRRLLGMVRIESPERSLSPQPTLGRIDVLVDHVRQAGLSIELRVEGEARPLPPGLDLSAYRIVQEALTNVLKHASAERAEVLIQYGPSGIHLEVRDDGSGMDGAGHDGRGLIGMRERVALYHGEMKVRSTLGAGFELCVDLPIAG